MCQRDFISLSDLSCGEITGLLDLAEQMALAIGFDDPAKRVPSEPLDRLLATMFYEPSTRTRLSFEAAMMRLGGQVLGFADAACSSHSKGESLADSARMISVYADIIVIRHPLAGAAKVVADAATVPVINAGDGVREHPTQTLTDLFCIRREAGTLEGLTIGLCGDLKYGRTVHSLAPVMAGWGCRLVGIAPAELALPPEVIRQIKAAGGSYTTNDSLEDALGELDVLYMTRLQRERFPSREAYEAVKGVYVLTPELMNLGREGLRVLHPLPRVDEIDPGVDVDRRAAYFRQAAGGVPVRMALIAWLLGLAGPPEGSKVTGFGRAPQAPSAAWGGPPAPRTLLAGPQCLNPRCITSCEPHLSPDCYECDEGLACAYCEQLLETVEKPGENKGKSRGKAGEKLGKSS